MVETVGNACFLMVHRIRGVAIMMVQVTFGKRHHVRIIVRVVVGRVRSCHGIQQGGIAKPSVIGSVESASVFIIVT